MLSKILLRTEALVDAVLSSHPQLKALAGRELHGLLRAREEVGIQSYGTTLDEASNEEYVWKDMILEELADALLYCTKYAEQHGPQDVVNEMSMMIIVMITFMKGLRGNEEPDTVSDKDSGSGDGEDKPRLILLGEDPDDE